VNRATERVHSGSYYGPFASKQTANNKSPHSTAEQWGENTAHRASKQIHAMQKQAA
jgi:hypothetical protein